MIVVGLPNALGFDEGICKFFNYKLIKVHSKIFPDGETYVRIPESVSGKVIIVQSFFPNQNDRIMEVLLTLNALNELGVKDIVGVFPYMAYTRQDKIFMKGEPISIKALLKIFEEFNLSYLVTVDVHNPNAIKQYFKGNFMNIIPSKVFASYLRKKLSSNDIIIVSPDLGGIKRAEALAKELNTDFIYLEKFRDRITGEVSLKSSVKTNIKNKVAVIVDDIISTGGTIALASKYLKKRGIKEIFVVCSHGLFVRDSISKIKSSGVKEIVSLNTVKPVKGITYLDVIPLVNMILRDVVIG